MRMPFFDLKNSGLPELTFISELKSGENNYSYLHEDANGKKYVIRQKKYMNGHGSLEEESNLLKFFEYAGVDFTPRSFYYDAKNKFHVISFVEGEDIGPAAFSTEQADLFARQLAILHDIPFEMYAEWREQQNLQRPEIKQLSEWFQTSFIDTAKLVDINCTDRHLAEWVVGKVAVCKRLMEASQTESPVLAHGDLGGNMRWDGKKLTLIDWEHSGFRNYTELGYIFVHGSCPDHLQKRILGNYIYERALPANAEAELRRQIAFQTDITCVDKVAWRTKRFTEETLLNNENEARRFHDWAYAVLDEHYGDVPQAPRVLKTGNPPEAKPV